MLDILDILEGRAEQTAPGTYYPDAPDSILYPTSAAQLGEKSTGYPIDYEYVDPASWSYRTLFSSIMDGASSVIGIKTRDQFDYKVGGYIVLTDGSLCQITAFSKDVRAAQKGALRYGAAPIGTEYVLRLVSVDNPRGVT